MQLLQFFERRPTELTVIAQERGVHLDLGLMRKLVDSTSRASAMSSSEAKSGHRLGRHLCRADL
jgi:hypothetical protein